jgi:uncharacterized membrane protein required for colicin V production
LWRGWRQGFIGMLLHLVGVFMVFFLIAHYFPMVKHGLMHRLQLGVGISTILSVILILVMIALIVQIIKMVLERTISMMHMSFINSAIGAMLGFMTGLLITVVISILIDTSPAMSQTLENSSKHRVYAGIKVIRGEMYSALKLKTKFPVPVDSTSAVLPIIPE